MATSFYEPEKVDAVVRELRIDPQLLRRARIRFFKKSASIDETLAAFPPEVAEGLRERIDFQPLTLSRRYDSQVDGASRIVFRTRDGFAIESVVLRASTGRVALCVSSQVGCAAACAFCATGKMGITRSLAPHEILDQVTQANRILAGEGRRVRNLVFMGMGEPLHNEKAVLASLRLLEDGRHFHHPPSRTLLSTVGVPDAMLRMVRSAPSINYALSLHAVDQSTRERLIPLARRFPIDRLRETVGELNARQDVKRSVMIEHLMLRGVNDSDGDAAALVEWCRSLRVHVNLIPFNPIDEAPTLTASPRAVIERFGGRLRSAGIPTTIRYSMGGDIAAACGQLVRNENRRTTRQTHLVESIASLRSTRG